MERLSPAALALAPHPSPVTPLHSPNSTRGPALPQCKMLSAARAATTHHLHTPSIASPSTTTPACICRLAWCLPISALSRCTTPPPPPGVPRQEHPQYLYKVHPPCPCTHLAQRQLPLVPHQGLDSPCASASPSIGCIPPAAAASAPAVRRTRPAAPHGAWRGAASVVVVVSRQRAV